MQGSVISNGRHRSTRRRVRVTTAVAAAGMSLCAVMGMQVAGDAGRGATPPASTDTGFTQPFSGTPSLEEYGAPSSRAQRNSISPSGKRWPTRSPGTWD